ncbi:citrate/2-methylcitrate synthase [Amycolatopsis carbonis]|uniref:citrate synthase (unknown stereospecificity) n=1 Tax=Amycolatopsis carbonis TaxID=715471 RepID=A0A9Y2MUC9_9PSEU|nr:citrate/2-methylcitrate synthase [Amycolatopsis sp. 2-15]WIX77708.1 citrate/2-methylcitrate synthase [Amycolatopsis sp. 2-15]
MSTDTEVLSIAEAADVLGVKQSTVYAYISRGLLKRHRLPRDRRSWLSRSEVEGFGQRKGTRTLLHDDEPAVSADTSQVARLDGDALLYRERDAVELARTASYEEVAELLWEQPDVAPARDLEPELVTAIRRLQDTMPASSLPLDRLKVTATLLGARDSFRYDLSVPSVLSAARTMAPAFVESLPQPGAVCERGRPIAERLWGRLTAEPATPERLAVLSAALVLLADHGLGPSTRAVREAAAKAADPYSAVLAGMSVASGLLLGGGSSLAVQAWLGDIASPASVSRVLEQRLLRGDRLSGFGQPRYRSADPRATELLRLLAEAPADPERLAIVEAAIDLVRRRRDLEPNVEFALGALCFVHGMAEGAGEAVFVIARTAGWIAHSLETYTVQ